MKRFHSYFDFEEEHGLIIALKKKEARNILPEMIGGVSRKHIHNIKISENPEEYVLNHFKNRVNSSKYEMLQIYFNLDEYNKVYQYFNLNERVFAWDCEKVKLLARQPPNMVNNICDEYFPNVYAVMSFFPDLDREEYLKGFTLNTIYHVRKYIVTEDINSLSTAYNQSEVTRLFEYLVHLSLMKKISKDTQTYYVLNKQDIRPTKRARVMMKKDCTLSDILKNTFPSFEAIQFMTKNKNMIDKMIQKQAVNTRVVDMIQYTEDIKPNNTSLYVVFSKPEEYNFKCYRYGTDKLENKLKTSFKPLDICLVFKTKFIWNNFKMEKHPCITNITKLEAIYYYMKLTCKNGIKSFNYSLNINLDKK